MKMYTEEDYKKLFKRFFGNDAKICRYQSSISYMKKNDSYFRWDENDDAIFMICEGSKPYTWFMENLYGQDISVHVHDRVNEEVIHYHVPSSYEEMCIICDLNGI